MTKQVASYWTWAHTPTMPMAVASPQSATRPVATRPACLARLSPAAASLANSIIDFSGTYARAQHWPAAGHVMFFNGQKIPKSAPSSRPKCTKGEKTCYPQVYHPAKFYRPASTHGDIAYKNSYGHTDRNSKRHTAHCLSALWGNKY